MKPITTSAELKFAIMQLKSQQASDLVALKQEFARTREALKPMNLIRSSFREATASPDLKADVFNAVIGLTTGILTKKLIIGKTGNPFKKILGIVVEMAVANKVVKNADDIKSTGTMLFNKLFKKKEPKVDEYEEMK